MQKYSVVLFDLDGTLTDSAPGILNSVRYACRKMQLPEPAPETLRRFLSVELMEVVNTLPSGNIFPPRGCLKMRSTPAWKPCCAS